MSCCARFKCYNRLFVATVQTLTYPGSWRVVGIFSFKLIFYTAGLLKLFLSRFGRQVRHSLLGTYTAVNSDEFTCVLWLDGEEVDSYSSNGTDSVPRRNWMREGEGRSLWKSVKRLNMEQWNRGRIDILKNYSGLNMSGAAVLQGRFGCEIEQNPDSDVRLTKTYAQYGWNGEDFLSFSLSRLQWVASAGSAVPMKKWNRDEDITMDTKNYIDYICVMHLLKSLSFEAKESQMTAQPTAAVFAKRSLNPGKVILTCLVSGFHCRDTTVEVYQDDDIITEEDGLLSSGIRPNGDGTCQLRKSLDISNSTEASYSCEVPFGSLKRLVKWDGKIWDRAEQKQDYNTRRHYWWLIMPLFGFFILILGVIYRWYTAHRESLIDASEDSQLEAANRASLQERHYESNPDHAETSSQDDRKAEPFSESEGLISVDGSKDEGGPVAHEGGCHV